MSYSQDPYRSVKPVSSIQVKGLNHGSQAASTQSAGEFRSAQRQDLLGPAQCCCPYQVPLGVSRLGFGPPVPFLVFINFLWLNSLSLSHLVLPLKGEILGRALELWEMRSRSYVHLTPNPSEGTQLPCPELASPTLMVEGKGGIPWREGIWLLTNNEDELIRE